MFRPLTRSSRSPISGMSLTHSPSSCFCASTRISLSFISHLCRDIGLSGSDKEVGRGGTRRTTPPPCAHVSRRELRCGRCNLDDGRVDRDGESPPNQIVVATDVQPLRSDEALEVHDG